MNSQHSAFQELSLPMLSVTGHTQVFEDELLLTDNLGMGVDTDTASDFMSAAYPFRIAFTLVMFCCKGSMRVRLNLQEYALSANDVLVVLPGAIGECLDIGSDAEAVIMGFAGSRLVGDHDSTLSMAFRRFFTSTSLIHISSSEMEENLNLYRQMWAKLERPDFEFKKGVLAGYLQVFFYNGCQWMRNQQRQQLPRVESRQQQLFEDFLKLVQAHYGEQRGVRFYADALCLTSQYLSQVILKVSGRYAGDWIRDYVILEAKALLKSGHYTVQQVSEQLNFPNPSFFGKYFKAAVGCSPRRYMLG